MDSARITAIYTEIEKYVVRLESDPASLGPRYLTDIIAKTRNYLNATNRLVLEVHRERHTNQTQLTALEAAYDLDSSDLLANDDRVRRLPNIDDRKATVAVMLRDRLRAIQELRGTIQDLDIIDKAIRFRHKELKDTMSEIRLQRALVRDELDTKSFYGDERTGEVPVNGRAAKTAIDIGELETLLEESALQGLPQTPQKLSEYPATGQLCDDCGEPQYQTEGGPVCCNGHGGAPGHDPEPLIPDPSLGLDIPEPADNSDPAPNPLVMTDEDFDTILQNV
jgi:hypothetical protein